jgi:hypothetical protein
MNFQWAGNPRLIDAGRERVMSSYARYCRDQAAECARRVKLASSPEVVANCRDLGLRWLKLAEKAEMTSRPLGNLGKAPVALGAHS